MNEYITIEKQSENKLTLWTWRFWFNDMTLWLDYYSTSERPTSIDEYKVTGWYSRLPLRAPSSILEADVVLPAAVQDEALQKVRESITVKRWGERKAE